MALTSHMAQPYVWFHLLQISPRVLKIILHESLPYYTQFLCPGHFSNCTSSGWYSGVQCAQPIWSFLGNGHLAGPYQHLP